MNYECSSDVLISGKGKGFERGSKVNQRCEWLCRKSVQGANGIGQAIPSVWKIDHFRGCGLENHE